MDFIERLFGVSPDGGNGTIEALILFAASVVLMALVWRRRRNARWTRR
jgi:MYXO-CTERM domain-containing protein